MGLLAYYKLEEDGTDFSGNDTDLAEVNTPTYVSGQVNNAGKLTNGSNNYWQNTGLVDEFDNLSAFSIAFWFRYLDTPATSQRFIHIHDGSYVMIRIRFTATHFRVDAQDDVGTNVTVQETLANISFDTDQLYHHCTVTFDGTDLIVYIDNEELMSVSGSITPVSAPTTIQIGSDDFSTEIDDFRIYSHVLTQNERFNIYNFTGLIELLIEGRDFSMNMYDWNIDDQSIYMAGETNVNLLDPDGSIDANINRYNDVEVYYQGIRRFTGAIIDIDDHDDNSSLLDLNCQDYWTFFLRSPHTAEYIDKTASYIINDMVTNNPYLKDLGLDTSGIVDTDKLYTVKYLGRACHNVAMEMALNESFVIYVDENKKVIFKSNSISDTGIHLDYGNDDIKNHAFHKTGNRIVNVVRVRGSPGQPPDIPPVSAIYEDDALIAKLGKRLPMLEINAPELTTKEACRDRGEYEARKRNEDPTRGDFSIDLNFDLVQGSLVTITVEPKNVNAEQYVIQSVNHSFAEYTSKIVALYYTNTNADLIQAILEGSINASQYLSDEAAIFSLFKTLRTSMRVTATVTVERQTTTGAAYGEFDYGVGRYYGQQSAGYSDVISDQPLIITNISLENILRRLCQIATVPNALNSANTHIAFGTGVIEFTAETEDLTSEIDRVDMEGGYPNTPSSTTFSFQGLIEDIDLSSGVINELGILDDDPTGNLHAGVVLESSVSKSEDETIRTTITFTFADADGELTSAGMDLIRDILIGASAAYADAANAGIEIITDDPTIYREGMDTDYPKFSTVGNDQVTFQMEMSTADIIGAGLGGEKFTIMDLYNDPTNPGGTQIIDGTVGETEFNVLQELIAQILLKIIR